MKFHFSTIVLIIFSIYVSYIFADQSFSDLITKVETYDKKVSLTFTDKLQGYTVDLNPIINSGNGTDNQKGFFDSDSLDSNSNCSFNENRTQIVLNRDHCKVSFRIYSVPLMNTIYTLSAQLNSDVKEYSLNASDIFSPIMDKLFDLEKVSISHTRTDTSFNPKPIITSTGLELEYKLKFDLAFFKNYEFFNENATFGQLDVMLPSKMNSNFRNCTFDPNSQGHYTIDAKNPNQISFMKFSIKKDSVSILCFLYSTSNEILKYDSDYKVSLSVPDLSCFTALVEFKPDYKLKVDTERDKITIESNLKKPIFHISTIASDLTQYLRYDGCKMMGTTIISGDKTILKIQVNEKDCSIKFNHKRFNQPYSVSYAIDSPFTTVGVYDSSNLKASPSFEINYQDDQFKYIIHDFHPHLHACIHLKNKDKSNSRFIFNSEALNNPSLEYVVQPLSEVKDFKHNGQNGCSVDNGAVIVTRKRFTKQSYSISIPLTLNNPDSALPKLTASYYHIFTDIFFKEVDVNVVCGDESCIGQAPHFAGEVPNIYLNYSLHKAFLQASINNTLPKVPRVYFAYHNVIKTKVDECTVQKGQNNPVKMGIFNAAGDMVVVGPFNVKNGVDSGLYHINCTLQLNPKQIDNTHFSVYILPDNFTPNPSTPVPQYLDSYSIDLPGNNEATLTEPLLISVVNWTLSSNDITSQVERAKNVVIRAAKLKLNITDPLINLVDLTYYNPSQLTIAPSMYPHSFSSYFIPLSTPVVSARFNGVDGQFNLEDLQNAVQSVIDNDQSLQDLSTSAILDQIFSECIEAGYGCGDLCAPCTGNDPCKSDFDCFSGVCSFGQCADFDYKDNNSVYSHFEVVSIVALFFIAIFLV